MSGDHIDLLPSGGGLLAERADDVVRLEVLHLDSGDAVGLQQLADQRHGDTYALGRLLALCLVLGVLAVAEGAALRVEDYRQFVGLCLAEQVLQHEDEAEDGRDIASRAIDAWVLDEGVVGAVDQRVGVEEEEA